jgi:hypothetical protein
VNDHIPDATKMISDTPISDSTPHNAGELGMLCRRLERKLAATRHYLAVVSDRVKRLEEAGDVLYEGWIGYGFTKDKHLAAWLKAKEDKP